MGVASEERQQLCALFEEVGPEAPTLCEGWVTRDLAAHLAMRERRPDALAGMFLGSLAERTERVQTELRNKPWPELVELVRGGPPKWNPMAFGKVDELANTAEFFVHHEDVRRARAEWEPRPHDAERAEAVWRALVRMARVGYRRSPVGVTLRRPDGTEIAAKRGPRTVRLLGEPGELLLHAMGRSKNQVEYEGNEADMLVVRELQRGF